MSDSKTPIGAAELLPCPFCQSAEVSMSYSATMQSPEPAARFVECETCATGGPAFNIDDLVADDHAAQLAAKAWNTRLASTPTLPSDAVKRLKLRAAMRTIADAISRGYHLSQQPSDAVERVARAMVTAQFNEWNQLDGGDHGYWMEMARAAIAAMPPQPNPEDDRRELELRHGFREEDLP